MRDLLQERNFPADQVRFFASSRSAGKELEFGGQKSVVADAAATPSAELTGIGTARFPGGGAPSREHAPRLAEAGATVVGTSSAWREGTEVPLIVSEVNPGDKTGAGKG